MEDTENFRGKRRLVVDDKVIREYDENTPSSFILRSVAQLVRYRAEGKPYRLERYVDHKWDLVFSCEYDIQ